MSLGPHIKMSSQIKVRFRITFRVRGCLYGSWDRMIAGKRCYVGSCHVSISFLFITACFRGESAWWDQDIFYPVLAKQDPSWLNWDSSISGKSFTK